MAIRYKTPPQEKVVATGDYTIARSERFETKAITPGLTVHEAVKAAGYENLDGYDVFVDGELGDANAVVEPGMSIIIAANDQYGG